MGSPSFVVSEADGIAGVGGAEVSATQLPGELTDRLTVAQAREGTVESLQEPSSRTATRAATNDVTSRSAAPSTRE